MLNERNCFDRDLACDDAPQSWFLRAVALCYERPDAAIRQMQKYVSSRGQSAFLRKLAIKPGYFGRRAPASSDGHIGYQAAQRRREISQATALLPLLAKEMLGDDGTANEPAMMDS